MRNYSCVDLCNVNELHSQYTSHHPYTSTIPLHASAKNYISIIPLPGTTTICTSEELHKVKWNHHVVSPAGNHLLTAPLNITRTRGQKTADTETDRRRKREREEEMIKKKNRGTSSPNGKRDGSGEGVWGEPRLGGVAESIATTVGLIATAEAPNERVACGK